VAVAATPPPLCAVPRRSAARALGTGEPRAIITVVHDSTGEEAAGERYAVAPNGVTRIGGGGGKQMGGEAAVVPCHPMAYPYMVWPAGAEALRVELLTTAAQGEGTRGGGGRRGRDRDRDAPRRHDDGLGRLILPDAQLRAVWLPVADWQPCSVVGQVTGWRSA